MASRWYIVQVRSGFEKEAARAIRARAGKAGLAGRFREVAVPARQIARIERLPGKRLERRFFPGYVLVHMELADDAWQLVQSIDHVVPWARPSPITASQARELRSAGR